MKSLQTLLNEYSKRLVTDHLLQAGVARNVFTWNDVLDGLVVGAHGGEMG